MNAKGTPLSLTRRHPRAVLAALVGVTLALTALAPFTRWDADPDLLTIEGSPELTAYRAYLKQFGSDELLVIAFERDDLLQPSGLALVRDLTDALYEAPGVAEVSSVDTAYDLDIGPFGPFARPLVPDDLDASPAPAELLAKLRGLALARGLVDATGTTTTLTVKPETRALGGAARATQRELLEGVEGVLARPEFAGIDFHVAGSPAFNREMERLNTRDNALFTPLAVALVALVLVFALRRASAVALALACVGGSVAWVRGAMTLLGVPINTTTSLLSPLVMVLGVTVSLHLLARYLRERAAGKSAAEAVDATEAAVFLPAWLTALTTALGFASLLVSRIPSVRSFGVFAAFGTLASFALGGIALPAALRLFAPQGRTLEQRDPFAPALAWLQRFAWRHAGAVLLGGGAALAASLALLPSLRLSTHDGEFFADDHPLNAAYDFIEARLDGVTPLELVIESDAPGGVRTPDGIALIRNLQEFLGSQPETTRGVSVADWIDRARDALEAPEERTSPLDSARLERASFLVNGVASRDLPYWVQEGWSRARISSRSLALDSKDNAALLARVRAYADRRLAESPGFRVTITGLVPVFAQMEEYLLQSQVQSFGSAALSIFVVFAWVFRSAKWGALAMIPNLVPAFVVLALMAAFGIPLDVVTVMVASVALGIVVDDTLHLLHAFRDARAAGLSDEAAMERAIATSGEPILYSTLSLGVGFSILMLSDFRPTAHFGGLTALTLGVGLVAELFLLPALVRVLAPALPLRAPAFAREAS